MFQLKLETSISACRWPRLIFSVFQTLFRPHELSDLSAQTALPRSRHGRWRGRRGRGRRPHVARWFFSHFGGRGEGGFQVQKQCVGTGGGQHLHGACLRIPRTSLPGPEAQARAWPPHPRCRRPRGPWKWVGCFLCPGAESWGALRLCHPILPRCDRFFSSFSSLSCSPWEVYRAQFYPLGIAVFGKPALRMFLVFPKMGSVLRSGDAAVRRRGGSGFRDVRFPALTLHGVCAATQACDGRTRGGPEALLYWNKIARP